VIGIIPAAGAGQRIQPLGCSKELLPVGARVVDGVERPKAVSEYLVERMIAAGATQICMVISAEKSDIVRYFAERDYAAEIFYVVQQQPRGLCDALFRAEPFVRDDQPVLIGLPDTIWFPENAYTPAINQNADVNLVLFPVQNPAVFDAVVCDELGYVERVEVKRADAHSHWIWGAVTARGNPRRLSRGAGLPARPEASRPHSGSLTLAWCSGRRRRGAARIDRFAPQPLQSCCTPE
jgi:dTDP-glucose pyrophosphorylase